MSNVNIFSLKNDNVLDDKSHSISGNTPYLSTKNTSFSAVNYSTFFDGIQNIFHVVKNCCRIATMEDLYLIFGCRNSFWLFMNYFIAFRNSKFFKSNGLLILFSYQGSALNYCKCKKWQVCERTVRPSISFDKTSLIFNWWGVGEMAQVQT